MTASDTRTPATIAYVILGAFLTAMILVLTGAYLLLTDKDAVEVARANVELALAIVGIITSVLQSLYGYVRDIIGFYFGSSQGSKEKTEGVIGLAGDVSRKADEAIDLAKTLTGRKE